MIKLTTKKNTKFSLDTIDNNFISPSLTHSMMDAARLNFEKHFKNEPFYINID